LLASPSPDDWTSLRHVFGREQLTVNTVPRTDRTVPELTPKLIGPNDFGIQIETTPKKISASALFW
jgi:hypothetical protein